MKIIKINIITYLNDNIKLQWSHMRSMQNARCSLVGIHYKRHTKTNFANTKWINEKLDYYKEKNKI